MKEGVIGKISSLPQRIGGYAKVSHKGSQPVDAFGKSLVQNSVK